MCQMHKGHINMKINKSNRIPWLHFASSYINAAKAISQSLEVATDEHQEKMQKELMVVPLLYLLRHALELSIKSIFISYNEDFGSIHDLNTLLDEAEKYVEIHEYNNSEKLIEIRSIIKEFSETTYGGKKLFTDEDLNSTSLRYLQVDNLDSYSELKNINHQELLKQVKRVRSLCEMLTLKTTLTTYWGK